MQFITELAGGWLSGGRLGSFGFVDWGVGALGMKLVFLGTGSAFSLENFQSNMLLEASQGRLLIDCGSDVRHSLGKESKTALDITDVYISHLHADHIGGLEWLGLVNYFARTKDNPGLRPRLHIRETLLDNLWQSLHGGMGTLEAHVADLSTYFDLCPIERNGSFSFAGTQLRTVQVVHYYDGYEIVPSYGLLFERNGIPVFITTDTQIHPNQMSEFRARADYIFHDCETAPFESGVHAHYGELATLDDGLKGKLWLYGYQDGAKSDCEADGFLGWVRQGQVFDFENPASFRPARPK
jgi:ribonuclease BN (tRNA processing enzyme)